VKVRVSARDKTGDVSEVEAEVPDYQAVNAGLLESMPGESQVLMIKVDRPEVVR
jgi:hypothetical protein